jgi:hypothetical protein
MRDLRTLLFTRVIQNRESFTSPLEELSKPAALCSAFVHPNKEKSVKQLISRFN